MFKKTLFILVTATSVGLVSCNSTASEKTPDKPAAATIDKQWAKTFIDSVNAKFSEEIAKGDSVSLGTHYWPDAELLLDNNEAVKGKDAVSAWGSYINMGMKEMSFSTTDIVGTLPYLIETGTYEIKDSAKALLDRGKYVVIWENRDGQWKLYRDIGCTSLPPAK